MVQAIETVASGWKRQELRIDVNQRDFVQYLECLLRLIILHTKICPQSKIVLMLPPRSG